MQCNFHYKFQTYFRWPISIVIMIKNVLGQKIKLFWEFYFNKYDIKFDDASSYLWMSLNFLVYFIISIAAYSVVKVTYIKKERLLRNSRSSRKVLRTLVCVVSVFPISLQYLQPSSAISRKRKQLLFLIKTT